MQVLLIWSLKQPNKMDFISIHILPLRKTKTQKDYVTGLCNLQEMCVQGMLVTQNAEK